MSTRGEDSSASGAATVDGQDDRLPDLVIIGAQKSASTEIMRVLASHPDCTLHPDEQHFFRDPYYDPLRLRDFARTLPRTSARHLGIKCPDYLGRPEVPARLAHHLPQARLVACLRNPVDRAVSAYYWYVQWGGLPLRDVNEGMPDLLDRRGNLPEYAYQVLSYGRYGDHLARYRDHFAPGRLHVVLQEDLRVDYQGTLATITDFLDLPPLPARRRAGSANSGVYSLPRLRLLRTRNRYLLEESDGGREVRIKPAASPWQWTCTKAVTALDRGLVSRLYGNHRPSLDPQLRRRLVDHYADDVERLGQLLGRDVGQTWGFR